MITTLLGCFHRYSFSIIIFLSYFVAKSNDRNEFQFEYYNCPFDDRLCDVCSRTFDRISMVAKCGGWMKYISSSLSMMMIMYRNWPVCVPPPLDVSVVVTTTCSVGRVDGGGGGRADEGGREVSSVRRLSVLIHTSWVCMLRRQSVSCNNIMNIFFLPIRPQTVWSVVCCFPHCSFTSSNLL